MTLAWPIFTGYGSNRGSPRGELILADYLQDCKLKPAGGPLFVAMILPVNHDQILSPVTMLTMLTILVIFMTFST